jgi:hypothetical protein
MENPKQVLFIHRPAVAADNVGAADIRKKP